MNKSQFDVLCYGNKWWVCVCLCVCQRECDFSTGQKISRCVQVCGCESEPSMHPCLWNKGLLKWLYLFLCASVTTSIYQRQCPRSSPIFSSSLSLSLSLFLLIPPSPSYLLNKVKINHITLCHMTILLLLAFKMNIYNWYPHNLKIKNYLNFFF